MPYWLRGSGRYRLKWLPFFTGPNKLISGGTICLKGADNYDSFRGDGLDFLVLDESASIAREAWTEVLRRHHLGSIVQAAY